MNQTARRESTLLLLGFCFQLVNAAALVLAPSVLDGIWTAPGPALAAFLPLLAWSALAVVVHRQLNRMLPARDPFLFPAAMFLCGWGLQILARLSPSIALRQTLWLGVASAILLVILHMPNTLDWLRKYRYLWMIAALAALAATFPAGIGSDSGSPRLWLGLAGIYLQPSEMLRWVFPVFAVFTLTGSGAGARISRRRLAPIFLFAAIAFGLLLLQPDLGASLLLFASLLVVVYLAYPKVGVLLLGGGLLLLSAGAGFAFNAVVRARILTWWNPWLDAGNTSYQVVQSLIAFASGGLIGRGPGLGAPGLVPVAYSDFLFTALGEEYGVVGAIGCLLVLSILVIRGLRVAVRSRAESDRLLAGALSAILGMQALLIIGGVLRLVPLTGVTLPWMSYGGSSLVACTVMLALLLILSSRADPPACEQAADRPLRILAGLQIAAVAAAAISLGWWGVYRAPVLRVRTDNARRVIHDLRIRRGNLLDRSGAPLAQTTGDPGRYVREYPDDAAAPVVGYSSARYGQSGMEGALDPWLRGDASRDLFTIWWSETVLGQGAEGSSARLTIDLNLQDSASRLLGKRSGAIVVLDARSGEVLALATEPTYRPGTLDSEWDNLLDDPRAPLLNRATQGLYPPGAILLPFLAAESFRQDWPVTPASLCDLPLPTMMGSHPTLLAMTLDAFRFNQAPVMDLPAAHAPMPLLPRTASELFPPDGGSGGILVSPMQVALAYASLAADGLAPAPLLIRQLETPGGWMAGTAPGHPLAMTTAAAAIQTVDLLKENVRNPDIGILIPRCETTIPKNWEVSWFAGYRSVGADRVVVVVALEGDYPAVDGIGMEMLARAIDLLPVEEAGTP